MPIKDFYYRYLRKYKAFRSLSFGVKRTKYNLKHSFHVPSKQNNRETVGSLRELKVALICDDMTWENIQGVCKTVYLTPENWYNAFETEQPDIFFCESAWQGISQENYQWDGFIAHNLQIWGDNRFVLKKILAYCRAKGIPTVFWNKEDPRSDDKNHSFTDTAILFDHVCTTAIECIPNYQRLGCESVHLLPMGFSPKLFYPIEEQGRDNTAVFFGSWYANYPERCKDTEKTFDMLLKKGIELTIYDRSYGLNLSDRTFPQKYHPYIKPAVPYREIRNELRKYRYAININTETDSETMFARRVLEFMACGRLIISNESKALRNMFPDTIWFTGDDFDRSTAEVCIQKNADYVLANQSFEQHILRVFRKIEIIK